MTIQAVQGKTSSASHIKFLGEFIHVIFQLKIDFKINGKHP
jgi:hypothetical protein